MSRALGLGILASFFFAFTFILNSNMSYEGGSFIWSAVLRYVYMIPLLYIVVARKGKVKQVFSVMKENKKQWIVWSTVGFGFFYAPLTLSSLYGPSWLVAGTWQITIIAGAILSPLFFTNNIRNKIPTRFLWLSSIILIGIALMQIEQAENVTWQQFLLGVVPVIIAAFSYPLGNRKMMEVCGDKLDTFGRVFGMTVASMPFWLLLSVIEVFRYGFPSVEQHVQSFIVALFSGVIATVLFFKATDLTKHSTDKLAIIESTQAGELLFTLLGEMILLKGMMPSNIGIIGIFLVVVGMVVTSLFGVEKKKAVVLEDPV